jgi:hypothetical protein
MALGGAAEDGPERLTGGERIGGAGGVEKREDAEAAGAGGGAGGAPADSIFLRSSREGPISSSQGSSAIVVSCRVSEEVID